MPKTLMAMKRGSNSLVPVPQIYNRNPRLLGTQVSERSSFFPLAVRGQVQGQSRTELTAWGCCLESVIGPFSSLIQNRAKVLLCLRKLEAEAIRQLPRPHCFASDVQSRTALRSP